jgi:hypothetical protein
MGAIGLGCSQRSAKSLAHVWESIVNFGYVEWGKRP